MKNQMNYGRPSTDWKVPLILTGAMMPLATLILSAMSTDVAVARIQTQYPVQVHLYNETDAVMPGQPIMLRWEVSDTADRDTIIHRHERGEDWLQTITLSDASGRKVSVINRNYVPLPLIGGGNGGALVARKSHQGGNIVLSPQWSENVPPGNYTLNVSVRLAYEDGTKPLPVVEQEISLPVRVVPLSPEKMHALAESLSVALYARDYKGQHGSREAAITQLFALPEVYAGDIWRRVVGSEMPPESIASEYLLNQLILMRTPAAADVLADMWRQGRQSLKPDDWHKTLGYLGLYKMYAIADPKLRTYIENSFLRIDGKVPPKFYLEKGIPPVE